jgi:lysophospholipase L1-like esterase
MVLALLIGSVALNAMLYRYARRYFYEAQELRLDPAGLLHYPTVTVSAPHTNRYRVVLFGDSRAEMWNADTLRRLFDVVNRGIGSQTTLQVLNRIDPHVIALDADAVVLQVGVNDLKDIGLFPERRASIVAACKRNIGEIVQRITSRGVDVLLTTVFPHGPIELERRPFWNADIDSGIVDVNRYIATLADSHCQVIDAFQLLARDNVVDEPYEIDALHINERGYVVLNRSIVPVLQRLSALKQSSPQPG